LAIGVYRAVVERGNASAGLRWTPGAGYRFWVPTHPVVAPPISIKIRARRGGPTLESSIEDHLSSVAITFAPSRQELVINALSAPSTGAVGAAFRFEGVFVVNAAKIPAAASSYGFARRKPGES
jgi:hypothetical protein